MRQSKFDQNRDQRIADESGPDKQLMCAAHDCPNLWSTSDGLLCRWHAEAPTHRWPEVTRDAQDCVIDNARSLGNARPVGQSMGWEDKKALLEGLRTVFRGPIDPKAWIGSLEEIEASGERLSAAQKHSLAHVRQHSHRTQGGNHDV